MSRPAHQQVKEFRTYWQNQYNNAKRRGRSIRDPKRREIAQARQQLRRQFLTQLRYLETSLIAEQPKQKSVEEIVTSVVENAFKTFLG